MGRAVLKLTEENRGDFFALHHKRNGHDWCFCTAWWVNVPWPDFGARKAEENRILREKMFEKGEYDGYILYEKAKPLGWMQCLERDRLPKLCATYTLEADRDVWAITCFFIAPEVRGEGYARYLLEQVVNDLRRQGIKRVQAFPKRMKTFEPGEVWTGPEALFQSFGFTLLKDDPHLPVYELTL